ncbi:hypothetical protein [Nocardia crassostreae]|uniref:hypothetical protein n=1 Tax=Nocardia crassostreae TaxID=53428 RepID=UPI0012F7EBA5
MRADSPRFNRVRVIAAVSGVVAVLLAVATPLLPVRQDRASLDWPQPQAVQLTAPLVGYVPLSLDVTIPCTAIRDTPGGTVLSTIPAMAPGAAEKGLLIRVEDKPDTGRTLAVLLRNHPLLTAPITEIIGPGTTSDGAPTTQNGNGAGTGPGAPQPATTAPGGTPPHPVGHRRRAHSPRRARLLRQAPRRRVPLSRPVPPRRVAPARGRLHHRASLSRVARPSRGRRRHRVKTRRPPAIRRSAPARPRARIRTSCPRHAARPSPCSRLPPPPRPS